MKFTDVRDSSVSRGQHPLACLHHLETLNKQIYMGHSTELVQSAVPQQEKLFNKTIKYSDIDIY